MLNVDDGFDGSLAGSIPFCGSGRTSCTASYAIGPAQTERGNIIGSNWPGPPILEVIAEAATTTHWYLTSACNTHVTWAAGDSMRLCFGTVILSPTLPLAAATRREYASWFRCWFPGRDSQQRATTAGLTGLPRSYRRARHTGAKCIGTRGSDLSDLSHISLCQPLSHRIRYSASKPSTDRH